MNDIYLLLKEANKIMAAKKKAAKKKVAKKK